MLLNKLIHTVAHLRPIQVVNQLKNRLSSTPKLESECSLDRCVKKKILSTDSFKKVTPWIYKYDCFDDEVFTFLNLSSAFTSWNDDRNGMLWAYNLNYMDWLCQNGISENKIGQWIDKFIDELPNNKVGLDPYPIALRGINWIKCFIKYPNLVTCDDLNSEIEKSKKNQKLKKSSKISLGEKRLESLYSQYKLLTEKLEFHLMGNHLLEDVYSLFIASIYFEDSEFYKLSTSLLKQELDEQILPDGAHYEQSPMYHCILLDRLLDCYNISINNIVFDGQNEINSYLKVVAEKMLGHLQSIVYSDESFPLFNDAALGIAPTPKMIFDYANRLNLCVSPIPMSECGYRKLVSHSIESFVDVGGMTAGYQPGHSHADTFNYELRVNSKPFIVDTGISTYNKTTRRLYERSTEAHNTVTVNCRNSSEVWDGFRVGSRANVKIVNDDSKIISACHDGFYPSNLRWLTFLHDIPGFRKWFLRHTRNFTLLDDEFIVKDVLSQSANATSRIHFASTVTIHSIEKENECWKVSTNLADIIVYSDAKPVLKECEVSNKYNSFLKTHVLEMPFNNKLIYKILVKSK